MAMLVTRCQWRSQLCYGEGSIGHAIALSMALPVALWQWRCWSLNGAVGHVLLMALSVARC